MTTWTPAIRCAAMEWAKDALGANAKRADAIAAARQAAASSRAAGDACHSPINRAVVAARSG